MLKKNSAVLRCSGNFLTYANICLGHKGGLHLEIIQRSNSGAILFSKNI